MSEENEAPKLHVDSDWKAEAAAEKERMIEEQKAVEEVGDDMGGGGESGEGQIPPASFETLVSSMATQALMAMGAIADPMNGQRYLHLDLARHHIDMLGVLEEKCKGNLNEDESKMLSSAGYELRQRYITTVNAQREAGR